jgi:hypothetical protein
LGDENFLSCQDLLDQSRQVNLSFVNGNLAHSSSLAQLFATVNPQEAP